MANQVYNIAKGMVAYYAGVASPAGLVVVPLESSGLVSDATMIDYDDLLTLLAGATNEQTTMGRKQLASVTVTTNDTNDRKEVDANDVTWTAATGNAVGAVVICYAPNATSGLTPGANDSNLIPLVKLDMAVTPSGGDITLVFGSGGFYQAS